MKKRRWTKREITFLKKNYSKILSDTIAEILNRSGLSVRHMGSRMGLSAGNPYKKGRKAPKGKESCWYGKRHYKKTKKKISKTIKKLIKEGNSKMFSEEHRKKINQNRIGKSLEEVFGEEKTRIWKKRLSKSIGKNWKNKKFKEEKLKSMMRGKKLKPNKTEKKIINLIQQNNLNFIYVGDGKKIIDGFCPDFIHKEKKLIIEMNGDYWHNLPNMIIKDKRKYKSYKEKGYKTLVLWEHELISNKYGKRIPKQKVIEKIKDFPDNKYESFVLK